MMHYSSRKSPGSTASEEDEARHETIVDSALRAAKRAEYVDMELISDGLVPSMAYDGVNRFATEVVRSKRYAQSARVSFPSLTVTTHANAASAYRHADPNGYYSPFDRIARQYSEHACGLTMKDAAKLGKIISLGGGAAASGSGVSGLERRTNRMAGVSLTATAPAAFGAPEKILAIAESTAAIKHTRRARVVPPKPLPNVGSPDAVRQAHRLQRSKAAFETREPLTLTTVSSDSPVRLYSQSWGEGEIGTEHAFDSWNPEAIDEQYEETPDALPLSVRYQAHVNAVVRFYQSVENIVNRGVVTSTGSGHRAPVPQIRLAMLENIKCRVPSSATFQNEVEMEDLLYRELDSLRRHYVYAAARASVEYLIRDPVECKELGIDYPSLMDSELFNQWVNKSYQVAEWRVLRNTGVGSLVPNLNLMNRYLCTPLPIMLELQQLWMDGRPPSAGWTDVTPSTYQDLSFVIIHTPSFKKNLPYALEEFAAMVTSHSKDVHDLLPECWLLHAGTKLSAYLSSLPDDAGAAEGGSAGERRFEYGDSLTEGSTANDKRSPFSQFVDGHGGRSPQRSAVPPQPPSSPSRRRKTRLVKIMNSASTLISRQLRHMVENSLESVAALFEQFSAPHNAGNSIFIINLRLRRRASGELASDLVEPSNVCMQPNLRDFQSTLEHCIDMIVRSGRNFQRIEHIVGSSFGGRVHSLLSDVLISTRHNYMNEATVGDGDEIVLQVKKRIGLQLEKFYREPEEILRRFAEIDTLLSGEMATNVSTAIREASGSDVGLALELLGTVSVQLEALSDKIKDLIPDVSYFPMFEVRAQELKDHLTRRCRNLLGSVMDAVVEENRSHMLSISARYNTIANTLNARIDNCYELRALQEFTNKSALELSDLRDQYLQSVNERVRFLLTHRHKFSREDVQALHTTFYWPSSIQMQLKESFENQAKAKKSEEEKLDAEQIGLDNELKADLKTLDTIAENSAVKDRQLIQARLTNFKAALEERNLKAENMAEREGLLDVPHIDFMTRIDDLRANVEPLERLWVATTDYLEKTEKWLSQPLGTIDPESVERTVEEISRTLTKVAREFERMGEKRMAVKQVATTIQGQAKSFLNDTVPLMLLICNPGMRERHWSDIEALTGIRMPKAEVYTVSKMLEVGLQHHTKIIEDICVSASKEYGLQLALDKMESEWRSIAFETKEYRTTGTRILTGVDEIQQLLDDHIVKTQAMRSSRFIRPFIEQITRWEETLVSLQDILDNWLKVQATWLYLEPIFSSEDIMRQMPTEGKMFKAVDNTWRVSMAQTFSEPSCIKVARRPGFLEALIDANAKLEQIQKGLNDYLETKRLAFPRFFFLSNDELLEILAETKDPLRVQPHLKKCFDGIAKLQFSPSLDITACFDPRGERMDFPYEAVEHRRINPNDSGGNVERWLIEVEMMMRKSLAHWIDISMADALSSDRLDWLKRWQGQVVICINQIRWCVAVEGALRTAGETGNDELGAYYDYLCSELMRTVELVRGDIPKSLRVAIGALVVMDVHNRDTVRELCDLGVSAVTDFDWLAQLRYYWKSDRASALSGQPGTVECRMINAMTLYAYEYIGNQDRLVITPLTDRCYRTLMGAIHLNLGGAPEGPAGTGKTETTKDLAKAIAIQCVVTNCSDGLDYLAMAKFFKGLASSGAWACFDEFNRIQLEVLSVVAQQILQIQMAKIRGLRKFVFEGTELELRPTCCPFITMNPGYAGRAELPDNLKVLFRTVAMMVPDYAMISEIILYSYGYTEARPLSVKIVTTYKLCSEQLSSQSHYDYGMRAVIAVLRAAGNLKRSDGHLPEDVLVLRSIIDVNLPKFLSPDVPLFHGITSDLFPGVMIDPPDRSAMRQAFEDICEARGLIGGEYFWEKVVQIYDMMVVRHGFMIVGLPFSGKSSAWKVLGDVLGLLSERFSQDKRWSKVVSIVQNPKSITMGQLYGQFDAVSHEWTDGVLAINYRNAATNRVGSAEDRKWLIFDGPVDAIWIENMNTVLDDNKKLCLMSGEIIAMTDVMSMIFEPMDLLVASPATVSRCGMIYLEPEKLGWQPIWQAWLQKHWREGSFYAAREQSEIVFTLFRGDVHHLQGLADWLIEPCLSFVRKECVEMSPTVDTALVNSLLNILEVLLTRGFAKYQTDGAAAEEVTDMKKLKQRMQDLECCFLFALLWSIGKSGVEDSQRRFSAFLEAFMTSMDCLESNYPTVWNLLQVRQWSRPDFLSMSFKGTLSLPMPMKSHFFECVYIPEDSKWKIWSDMLPPFSIAPNTPYGSIVVPNNTVAQVNYMVELLVPTRRNLLVCGPTGTGKSVYLTSALTTLLPSDKFKPLSLGFSAKTSANMTQDIIDGRLDKRRKGVYGPPQGQQAVIFIDDLNMPEVEEYGAQPPIELVRQLLDSGGWYDLKDKSWKTIIDTSLVAAMGPAGGGRNHVTPRLLRHFNLLCVSEFDDPTLRKIFSTIVTWHFSNFTADIRALSEAVVDATLETYRSAMTALLPTPQKSHYTFNLRDFSRVIQGVLLVSPSEEFNKKTLVRLWTHEALRVFGDRLIDDGDRAWLHKHLESVCQSKFGTSFADVFKHLAGGGTGNPPVTTNDLRSLIFGDYMGSGNEENRLYIEVREPTELSARMEEYLGEYNAQSRKPMDLVMFSFAIEHVSRVSRILKMPGGNALLVGVGGSGRQSVTRLAAFMAGHTVFQIEIKKNYSTIEWREDLKTVLKGAGAGAQPMTFLFSDTQIKSETFVEDINNLLNNGEVPNLFASDERAAVCESVRPFARQLYGKAAADMTQLELYQFFVRRVKQNLHIVLAMSPIGNAFRDRLRRFPALINCCTIDWFTAWPADALLAVAERFLSTVKFESDEMRRSIVRLCQRIHEDVVKLSEEFMYSLRRRNYVTPTSYLELIVAYKTNLDLKRTEVTQSRMRYEAGLDKLAFAAGQVNKMQKELEDLQPELMKSAADTELLMAQIQDKMPAVMETRRVVSAEAADAQETADKVQRQKDEVQADLDKAIPIINAAVAALNTIKPNEINEIKALSKPPEKIRLVCRAVCVMFDIKPVRVPDPNDPSKRIMDYWGPSQRMLSDNGFVNSLLDYDKDNIPSRIINEVRKEFISHPDFDPRIIAQASKAAEGMCSWVRAIAQYDEVAKQVAPKKEALVEAQRKLDITLAALNEKKAELQKVEDDLKSLEDQLAAARQNKADLEQQADGCGKKIVRANQLLDGLGGERERWGQFAADLNIKLQKLTGDVLVSSGLLGYLGPFTAVFRQRQMQDWVKLLIENQIPCSDGLTLAGTLGDAVKIRQWNIDGLPTDSFSIENGIVVFNARRWPLMIDPQGQANRWIRNMERSNNLQVIKLTDANYLRSLENSIQFGYPVLLENVGEELDPSLEPLLLKQLFKQGGVNCIRLGDSTVEYSDNFRFYITTKLRNPHYVPEISVKVTLLNFMITPEGLQDQLLGIVVSQERPDLEEQRNVLIVESAANKRQLQDIEDRILHIMSSSSGNILEDETAIETLNGSKTLSDEIKAKQSTAEETERNIDSVRLSYSPIAYSCQILFFCIADLANIEPVYQYSLGWFLSLFISSIHKSEKGRDVAKRLENLNAHFTYSLYRNVCRSLLEKDKLLFSFLLTSRIMGGENQIDHDEWFFLLTGGTAPVSSGPANPAPEWISQKSWEELLRLSTIPRFAQLPSDFVAHLFEWKRVYDSLSPQDEELPGICSSLESLSRLCALRIIRPDKLVLAIQQFVSDRIGEQFVKPPPFDLQSCYEDSSCTVPLVFILSPGSDPMSAVMRAAEQLKTTMEPISLGQGQGPKAEKLIERAREKGTWVVLQNCHLAPSWMTTLEKICEDLDPEDTHAGFRLWCTTYPSEVFPVTVLQNGVKMTNEPPKGIRANLLGSYSAEPIASDAFFGSSNKPEIFHRLCFGLCFFHAVVQERRLYGPLGWNIPYEFNESDLRISLQQLQLFLDENDEIPFKALVYTAGECNYGGRVTDDKDRRTLLSLLNRFYTPAFLDEEHAITSSGQFMVPPELSHEEYLVFIDNLPLVAPPEVFGLHDNATLTKDQNDTSALLNSVLDTESTGRGGGSSGSKEDAISAVAADIAANLPANFDMEAAQLKYPVMWEESMNTVLCQELVRFNGLLSLMRDSLRDVQKAVKGLVVMSAELEILGNQLFVNRVPALWKSRSYPSLKPLSSYISDQQERLAFFRDWLQNQPPSVFWISAFFFTQAFLTGSAQNFARRYTIPIDDVIFDFEMQAEDRPTFAPENGVYTYGLFLEGARWGRDPPRLEESLPKVLFALAPTIHWVPYRRADVPSYPHYKCPVYKTSDRRGVLATTGHSSNFVCFIYMPSDKPESHWVERGVAMLTQLDN